MASRTYRPGQQQTADQIKAGDWTNAIAQSVQPATGLQNWKATTSMIYSTPEGEGTPTDPPFDFGDPPADSGNDRSGQGYTAPRPVYLPRLQGPSEAELAQLAFNAVAAARMPYDAQRLNLAMGRSQGQRQIAAADRDARTATAAAYNQWRAATSDLDNRVGGVYDAAARNLAQNMSIANESMLARGFRPQAVNPEILLAMQSLGANARNYAVNRRAAGEDAARQDATGVGQITQAAQGTLVNTYALVLGQIAQQSAASEAQARLDAENRIFALRREIEQLNNQTAIQEALANSGR
jgi:hypothetical protein